MDKIVILHSEHSKQSRDFVEKYGKEYQVISWYDESQQLLRLEYLSKNLVTPSVFPSVMDTENKVIVHVPQTMEYAFEQIDIYIANEKVKKVQDAKKAIKDKLSETDYICLADFQGTDECKENILTYRQQLRNLFDNFDGNLNNLVWPKEPEYVNKKQI